MLTDMPGLRLENIRIQKAILAAPDYNCEPGNSTAVGSYGISFSYPHRNML